MLYLILWVLCGAIAAYMYQQKGQSQGVGFLVGFLLGPIGILLVLLSPSTLITCPYCAEKIQPEAKICKHCGQNIPENIRTNTVTVSWRGPILLGVIVLGIFLLCVAFVLLSAMN